MPSLSQFKTDINLERNGVWVPVGNGLEFLIARQGSPRFDQEVSRLTGGTGGIQTKHNLIDVEDMQEMLLIATARACLLNWKNMQEDDGVTDIVYSADRSEAILRMYPDLYRFVSEVSTNSAMYREKVAETNAGNSEMPSDG